MEAAQAIAIVMDWITSRKLDYPTVGLEAERFEAGWSVYAPVEVDMRNPMAFVDVPVGRSVFLVGDSGRISEVSSSIPPQYAENQFTAEERAVQRTRGGCDDGEFKATPEPQLDHTGPERRMDPRRIELNRRHSYEMGLLFTEFVEAHPDVADMSTAHDAAWVAYSADLLARHNAERSAFAADMETKRRRDDR